LQLIAYGLVINQFGQVLLTERAETGAPALPGDAVAPGELPPEAAARAVRAATGLIVLAVRLVELRYEAIEPNGRLALIFRCIQRGGEIAVAGGKPQAGFFAAQALPNALPEPQRAQIRRGFLHAGGPPHWETQSPALGARLAQGLRRLWPGADAPAGPDAPAGADAPVAGGEAAWQAQAAVLVRDAAGAVLWLPTPDGWRLPGGLAEAMEPPWETAVRAARAQTSLTLKLTNLSSVALAPAPPQVAFCFTAQAESGAPPAGARFFTPGAEPDGCLPQHLAMVADATQPGAETVFSRRPSFTEPA
jgi:ADP-ribose pyrophosphatase YjhB (NUDIX family)